MATEPFSQSKFLDTNGWSGAERRARVPHIDDANPIVRKIEDYIDSRLTQNAEAHQSCFSGKFDELTNLIQSGVPDGDMESHRRYHELLIRQAERRDKLQQALIEKTFAGLVWALVLVAGGWAWKGIKDALGIAN